MSRAIIVVMGFALMATFSRGAGAVTYYAKFCFRWGVQFDNNNMGEDYLGYNGGNYPAKYTRVAKTGGGGSGVIWYLDDEGCSPVITVNPGATYTFSQCTRAKRSGRDVYVLARGEDWTSSTVECVNWDMAMPVPYPPNEVVTWTMPVPAVTSEEIRVMPIVSRMLYKAPTVDWENNYDLKMSFTAWSDAVPPARPVPVCDVDNDGIAERFHEGQESLELSHVCNRDATTKFQVTHELGHMIAYMNSGPRASCYLGSEGMFRDPVDGAGTTCNYPADQNQHQCDSVCLGGASHSMTSREFTGAAQGEGWAHFVAAALMNNRSEGDGVFVHGDKRSMKWSNSHDALLEYPIVLDPSDPSFNLVYWEPPIVVPLSPGGAPADFVRWIAWECEPAPGAFNHYGTEWDWLNFFWNLWVDQNNSFSIAEISDVWANVKSSGNSYAAFCCWPANEPLVCVPKTQGVDCTTVYVPPFGNLQASWTTVGYLWEDDATFGVTRGIREQAQIDYASNPNKYNLFWQTGQNTRVDY